MKLDLKAGGVQRGSPEEEIMPYQKKSENRIYRYFRAEIQFLKTKLFIAKVRIFDHKMMKYQLVYNY